MKNYKILFLLQSWGNGFKEAKDPSPMAENEWKLWFFIHSFYRKLLSTFYVQEFKDKIIIEIVPARPQL